ncbi:unnamed protein product [Clavelina lepadiformis]|uniref:Coiled-coil-helix-coiled-coil-helix domain-containing protein 7 n=1 Tax=Clavelina lepadiformis TaxID=159417 RepID=A0ABP0FXT8_CLALP
MSQINPDVKRNPKTSAVTKVRNPKTNPCISEQDEVLVCMSVNSYKKEKCLVEIVNYQDCMTFWGKVKDKRMREGLKPLIPCEEERNQIKEYLGDKLPYIPL